MLSENDNVLITFTCSFAVRRYNRVVIFWQHTRAVCCYNSLILFAEFLPRIRSIHTASDNPVVPSHIRHLSLQCTLNVQQDFLRDARYAERNYRPRPTIGKICHTSFGLINCIQMPLILTPTFDVLQWKLTYFCPKTCSRLLRFFPLLASDIKTEWRTDKRTRFITRHAETVA